MSSLTRGVLALGMVLILLMPLPVAGEDEDFDRFDTVDTVEMIFYPFVPQGEKIDGAGPWFGSITVQNVEDADVRIWIFTDAGFDPDRALGTYLLPPNGAITLSAAALGLEEGSPLVVAAVFRSVWEASPSGRPSAISEQCGSAPRPPGIDGGWVHVCKPSIAGVAKVASPEPLVGATGNRTSSAHLSVDGYNAIPAQDVAWGSQSDFCDAIVAQWPDECSGIGTYEPLGYGVGFVFDGHSYLPIVQTNAGWNTEIRISNIDPSLWAGQVNVTLTASDQGGQAARDEHAFTFEETLRPGQSWALDLRAAGIPDDWVGSAHITSNVGVVAYAARTKPSDGMLMVNVAAPSTWATTSPGTELQSSDVSYEHFGGSSFQMHAPLVFRDYFGWNTGISIANIDEATNRVSITWFDGNGSMRSVDTRTIPARGQTYVYLPGDVSSGIGNAGWVGSVTISADQPFHAAVDQVKYETGEAMSYMMTASGAWAPDNPNAPDLSTSSLVLPLMQKGQRDGSGDTSGIQLFNPDPTGPVDVEVRFYSQVGDILPPTNFEPLRATIPARGHYTIYALDQSGMIPNTTGTARIDVVSGTGQIYGVSNIVNYDVGGDGSTAFNLVNSYGQYRFPISRTELP